MMRSKAMNSIATYRLYNRIGTVSTGGKPLQEERVVQVGQILRYVHCLGHGTLQQGPLDAQSFEGLLERLTGDGTVSAVGLEESR